MITILCIGKSHEDWLMPGLARYEKRLRRPWNINWELMPHSSHEGTRARQEESGRLLRRLDGRPYVILLDESGANITSPSFSELFTARLDYGTQVTIVIGGAYGVDETIHRRADAVISLSKLVFPHQLVRLIVTEQIYRAQQITQGSGYHHS